MTNVSKQKKGITGFINKCRHHNKLLVIVKECMDSID